MHGRPVVEMEEDNYFFKLSEFEQRLLDYYDSHPDAVRPITKRNEALGFIRGGLRDVSITRTSFSWGVPVPWDSGHVFYVWYDALINYLTVAGYGGDPAAFAARWGAAHHLIGKDILKFHCVWWPAMCMAAGIEPPAQIFVHGYLLVGGQKLGKTMIAAGRRRRAARPLRITDVSPLALADDFGVDPLRYHLLREVPLGGDGDFSYEGIVARYNADLANNLGNLVSRVATVVHSKCGGVGPARDPTARSAPRRPRCSSAATRGLGPLGAPRGAGGDVAAHRRRQRRARGGRALEDGARPGGRRGAGRRPRGAADRGLLIAPAMPSTAAEIWRRIGLAGDPGRPRLPERRRVGRLPRRGRRGEGGSAVPAAQGLTWTGWFDSHCHLQEEYLARADEAATAAGPRPSARAARPASTAWSASAPARHLGAGGGRGPGDGRRAGRAPRAWATVGLHPHEAATGVDAVATLLDREVAADDGAVVAVGECGLDYFYEHSPRDAQRPPSPRRSRWPTRTGWPW